MSAVSIIGFRTLATTEMRAANRIKPRGNQIGDITVSDELRLHQQVVCCY